MESLVDFFKRVMGFEPTSAQMKLLKGLEDPILYKKIVISSGRQTGKTLICAVASLYYCFVYSDHIGRPITVLLISAQENIVYKHLIKIFRAHPEFGKRILKKGRDDPIPVKGFTVSDNGSEVIARGGTGGQIRGHGADIVFIDEAADVVKKIITTAMGNLSGDINKLVLISTAHNTNSYFVELCEDHKKRGYEYYTWSELDCPWHNKEFLKDKKKAMSWQEYKVEVLGLIPSKSERAFFIVHKKVKVEHIVKEGGPKSVIEAGMDFGESVGYHVLSITEKNGHRRKLLYMKRWKRSTLIEEILSEIKKLLKDYQVSILKCDSKPVEYQKYLTKRLGDTGVVYIDFKVHKEPMLGQLKRHLQKGTIEIENTQKALFIELAKYRLGKRAGDDRVDSLALSVYESELPSPIPTGAFIVSRKKRRGRHG